MLTSRVICDSISDSGVRLTTLQLRYPRMVHADFMTHRVFSRNGRSSRAVPFKTLVKETPYVPHFMMNQPGMVASEEMSDEDRAEAERIWLYAAEQCQRSAGYLAELGVHKQWINRMLEWFGYIDVLVTSTDWANFLELRLDGGAQPEIIELAEAIKASMDVSTPDRLAMGDWHMPYIEDEDLGKVSVYLQETNSTLGVLECLKRVSVARCARLTIKPFDGDGSIEKELKRYELLMISRPVHASPAEHIATPDVIYRRNKTGGDIEWMHQKEHGNYYGWRQFRKMIDNNTIYDR